MSVINYYNKETKTLTIPYIFNEELKDIPEETEIIIFNQNLVKYEYSKFNKSVDNLPKNITHLTFGSSFNQSVNKLPETLTHLTFGRQTPVRLARPKIFIIFEMS
jgi:hypothetical protein